MCVARRRSGMPGPLDGIKVIELGIWVAAPAGAAILADWGAEVIKIEEPERGDPLRGLGATGLLPIDLDVNPAFTLDNRGKKGVAVNLRSPDAARIITDLVAHADVFISNLRRAALARLGLTYERLRAINPRLIYAALTGYG